MNCKECSKEFTSKRKNQKFCSDNCRNKHNVKKYNKRSSGVCAVCSAKLAKPSATYCKKHNRTEVQDELKNMTLGDYKSLCESRSTDWKNGSQSLARSWNKHLEKHPCQRCGYSLHVDFCHIHWVSWFTDDSTLLEMHNETNILVLCKNCHWEFDNDYLSIDQIPPRS